MKKFLSLVLALVMALGCMTVTAFANNFELYVGNVQVTAGGELDHTTFPAIKDGTVTYTAANGGNPAKLTLKDAVIEYAADTVGTGRYDIYNGSGDLLVIELIGTSSVHASSGGAIGTSGPLTIIGSGNLNVSTSGGDGIFSSGMLTFSMTGTVTATGGRWGSISANGGFTVIEGAGKIIARAADGEGNSALSCNTAFIETSSVPTGYVIVGAANNSEADETKMTAVGWKQDVTYAMIGDGEEDYAQTVVIYNPNAKPAEDPTAKSGSTTITANVAAPELEYEIVIPQAVTMNKAEVAEIGAASINMEAGKLKNATANTVISYTASGTNFKLSTDESKTMTATYYSAYTDASTNTVLDSTKAIEVYKNSALVDPLTKLYVGVTQTDWDAAAQNNPGTYTATVTYNFKAEEKVTTFNAVAEILATVKDFPTNSSLVKWMSIDGYELYISGSNLSAADRIIGLDSAVTKTDDNKYQLVKTTSDGTATTTNTLTFTLTGGVLTEVNLEEVIKMGGSTIFYGAFSFHAGVPVTVADVLSGITTFTPAYGSSDASATVTFGSNTLTIKNGSQATIAEISGDTVLGAQYASQYYAAGGIDGNKLTFWMNYGSLEYISVETSTDSTLARFFCSGTNY